MDIQLLRQKLTRRRSDRTRIRDVRLGRPLFAIAGATIAILMAWAPLASADAGESLQLTGSSSLSSGSPVLTLSLENTGASACLVPSLISDGALTITQLTANGDVVEPTTSMLRYPGGLDETLEANMTSLAPGASIAYQFPVGPWGAANTPSLRSVSPDGTVLDVWPVDAADNYSADFTYSWPDDALSTACQSVASTAVPFTNSPFASADELATPLAEAPDVVLFLLVGGALIIGFAVVDLRRRHRRRRISGIAAVVVIAVAATLGVATARPTNASATTAAGSVAFEGALNWCETSLAAYPGETSALLARVLASPNTPLIVQSDSGSYESPDTVSDGRSVLDGGTATGTSSTIVWNPDPGGSNWQASGCANLFGLLAQSYGDEQGTSFDAPEASTGESASEDVADAATDEALALLSADAGASAGTPVNLPPAIGVWATNSGTSSISLRWTEPVGADVTGVMVRRTIGAVPPTSPIDGQLVARLAAPDDSYLDTQTVDDNVYSYALFVYDSSSDYSIADDVTIATAGASAPFVELSGTMPANETLSPSGADSYVIDGRLIVPTNVTVSVEQGTVIKGDGDAACGSFNEITADCSIADEGSFDALGSSSQPIVLTSINDNEEGGITGSGTPVRGDWGGLVTGPSGSVDMTQASVLYSTSGLDTQASINPAQVVGVTVSGDGSTSDPTSTSIAPTTTTQVPVTTSPSPTVPASTSTTTIARGSTTTSPPSAGSGGGSITTDDSKANCLFMDVPEGVLSDSLIQSYEATTGVNYTCLEIFADADPAWTDWVNPWPTRTTGDNWDSWLAESSIHQLVLGQQLIPGDVCTSVCSDPLTWESACASGDYNSYATQLGENLVSEGAASTVLRLGKEFNGSWENDYIGSPSDPNYVLEEQDWAKCFDNEVTAMRAVPGEHFLFDWNPAACDGNFDFANAYPGNSYVDIIGIDDYDLDCADLETVGGVNPEGWNMFASDGGSSSLASIIAFAQTEDKPISLPEWGEDNGYGDDQSFVNDISALVKNNNTAYESYFDCNCDTIAPLGSAIPNSTAAYTADFG